MTRRLPHEWVGRISFTTSLNWCETYPYTVGRIGWTKILFGNNSSSAKTQARGEHGCRLPENVDRNDLASIERGVKACSLRAAASDTLQRLPTDLLLAALQNPTEEQQAWRKNNAAWAYFALALARLRSDENEEAIHDAEQAVMLTHNLHPRMDAIGISAIAHARLGQMDEARERMKQFKLMRAANVPVDHNDQITELIYKEAETVIAASL